MSVLNARLKREVDMLKNDPPPGITFWLEEENIKRINAHVVGPVDTPYEKGVFRLQCEIGDRYPFEPPSLKFQTKIYHPNVDQAGRICMDSLKAPPNGGWKPSMNIRSLLCQIQCLLQAPNPQDPLMAEIAQEYLSNRPAFEATAREWTKKYARS